MLRSSHFSLIVLCLSLAGLPAAWAQGQSAAAGADQQNTSAVNLGNCCEESLRAIPVAFPGSFTPARLPAPGATLPPSRPVPAAPAVVVPQTQPTSEGPEAESLMVTRMNGEVHFKHLQGPRIDPARALNIETGDSAASWAEFKMSNCTGRVWRGSQVSVFPDTKVMYLNKGALLIRVSRGSDARYSVIAGDFVCRIQGTVLRVQRTEKQVSFQVLEGVVTVYNRHTGEVFKAGQVVQSLH